MMYFFIPPSPLNSEKNAERKDFNFAGKIRRKQPNKRREREEKQRNYRRKEMKQ
jgi:hypothetical protein